MDEPKTVKKRTAGILVHVDAGKTTLSEALLYEAGMLRKLGRVDHGDRFLDTHVLEWNPTDRDWQGTRERRQA